MKRSVVNQNSVRFTSLRVKLLIGFTVLFSGVFSGAYYWFYTFAIASATEHLQDDLIYSLNGAISGVDGDEFAALAKLETPPGQYLPSDRTLYDRHQQWLNKVHTIEPRSLPYTYIRGEEPHEVQWIGDIFRIIRPQQATQFREAYIADPAETELYRGLSELTVNITPYTDKWGTWVSAYGPIRNSAGQIVGGIGIDLDASYVVGIERTIRDRILIAFAITYSTLFVLVYILSGMLTRHLTRLTQFAESIGTGDYQPTFSLSRQNQFPDEMDILARVFESMVHNIHSRERLLKAVIEDQTELICRFLPDRTLTFVNQAYCHYFGQEAHHLINSNFLPPIPEEDQNIPEQQIKSLSFSNPVAMYEHRVILSHGAIRWQQWTVRAVFDNHTLIEFQGVGRDITDKKRAEEALRESEIKYRALVEQIPAVTYITVLDNPGQALYISPQIETLLGYSQEEWVSNPNLWFQQLHPDDRDRIVATLTTNKFSQNEALIQEYRLITRSGNVRWVMDSATVLADEAGHPLFLQGVVFDVSDRKRVEEELLQLNTQLEKRVHDRTEELTLANKQLYQSLNEKELLLKEVHHRVKNNLQIISSIFSLQSQCIKDPQVLSTLTESQDRIRSMALIHEKLYQSPSLSKIDFADYIRSLATSLFSSYNTNPNLVCLNLQVDDLALTIDTAIPCGLLINELISNSLKHAFSDNESGHINIHFSMNAESHLCLIVQDSGKGLPPDIEISKTNSLGLRLVRALTRQLGGKLDVENNQGATFKVTFSPFKERKIF